MRLSALTVPLTVPAPSHGAVVPPLTRKVPENWPCVCEVIDQTSLQLVEMLAAPDVNTSSREPDQPPVRLVEGGAVALVGEVPPQPGTVSSDSASKAIDLIADHCTSHAPIRHSSATVEYKVGLGLRAHRLLEAIGCRSRECAPILIVHADDEVGGCLLGACELLPRVDGSYRP